MNNPQKEVKTFFGMVTLLAIVAMGIFVISAWNSPKEEKMYPVNDTINGWVKTTNGIEFVKQQVNLSDLSAKTRILIVDSILTPLQNFIGSQVSVPYQADQKKIKDSVDKAQKPKQ